MARSPGISSVAPASGNGLRRSRKFPRPGFTLIELLVVIGVIGVLIGFGGFALAGRGSEGPALTSAQNLVAGLVGSARAQAALHHTNARLIIYAQLPPGGDARKYLRALQVVREEPYSSGQYVAAGDPVVLPEPICVVPSPSVPTNHLGTGVVWQTNPAPVSTLVAQNAFNYFGRAGAGAQRQFFGVANSNGRVFYLQFGPDGRVSQPASGAKIAVAPAVLSPSAVPRFSNPRAVRGTILRRSGAISTIDDVTGF